MKKVKKIMCIFLALVMFASTFPVVLPASAETAIKVGDIIEFGSYPQSEVTDDMLKAALVEQETNELGDLTYKGQLYRRYKFNNVTHFYLYEPIEWQVLSNDNNVLFVVSKKILNMQQYNETNISVTWENCTLRTWLNSTFYSEAFSAEDKQLIKYTKIRNTKNQIYNIDSGNDTWDNIFVLSLAEAAKAEYGFCTHYNPDSTRTAYKTSYAAAVTGKTSVTTDSWWLRTIGGWEATACSVSGSGYITTTNTVYSKDRSVTSCFGVRPALYLDGYVKTETEQEKEEPVKEAIFEYGDRIELGSYPQTEVTDESLKSILALQNADYDGDLVYDGKKYRRLMLNNSWHFYLYEPIEWKVLICGEDRALAVAEKILDTQKYNSTQEKVTWEESSLRDWLNDVFYFDAFSVSEQGFVKNAKILNDDNLVHNVSGGNDTWDNVFLLAFNDVVKTKYGFIDHYNQDVSRIVYKTSYAAAVVGKESAAADTWWLRTIGGWEATACAVSNEGYITTSNSVYSKDRSVTSYFGVRPAIYFDVEKFEEQIKDEKFENTKNYVQQHYNFVQSNKFLNLIENAGFYNTIWQYEEVDTNFGAYAAWEVIGDIGEVFTLSFNDLFAFDNPYEAILADILSSCICGENNTSSLSNSIAAVFDVNSVYKDFMSLLRSSENWENTIKSSDVEDVIKEIFGELEENLIQGVFVSPKKMNLKTKYPLIYDTLEQIWPDTTNVQWGKIFKGINNVSTVFDYLNTSVDVISCFFEAYQKYVIAKALVSTHQDLLNTILDATKNMPEKSSRKLTEAINAYINGINLDSAFLSVSEYMFSGSVLNVWNILKGSLEDIVYRGIAKMLGITAVSSVNAAIIAYNTTYAILDSCSGVGGEADIFFLLNAAALFEKSLMQVIVRDASNLINNKSLETAAKFDTSYGLLQALEQYTYHGFAEYCSAMKREFKFEFNLMSATGGFVVRYFANQKMNEKLSSADNAIATAVFLEGEWRNKNCHTDNATESKLVTVKCPTDVYVYDANNNLVMSIINNKIIIKADNIATIVDGDEKIFYLPETGEYNIKIIGTDKGSMSYSIYDSTEFSITDFVEYETISLIKDCVYEGKLSLDDEDENSYVLTLNKDVPCNHIDENNDLICDFCEDEIKQETEKPQEPDVKLCAHICHSNNEFLQFIWKIYNFIMRLFSMEKYCSCGAAHY